MLNRCELLQLTSIPLHAIQAHDKRHCSTSPISTSCIHKPKFITTTTSYNPDAQFTNTTAPPQHTATDRCQRRSPSATTVCAECCSMPSHRHLAQCEHITPALRQLHWLPVWRVSPFVHCRAWRRITLLATVSWLLIPNGDPCSPRSEVSATGMCHVRTALLVTKPLLPPVRVHGMSCHSVYVTLGYR